MREHMFAEAERLRDEFLKANNGNVDDALLAACQVLVRTAEDLERAKRSSSAGFLRSGRVRGDG